MLMPTCHSNCIAGMWTLPSGVHTNMAVQAPEVSPEHLFIRNTIWTRAIDRDCSAGGVIRLRHDFLWIIVCESTKLIII